VVGANSVQQHIILWLPIILSFNVHNALSFTVLVILRYEKMVDERLPKKAASIRFGLISAPYFSAGMCRLFRRFAIQIHAFVILAPSHENASLCVGVSAAEMAGFLSPVTETQCPPRCP